MLDVETDEEEEEEELFVSSEAERRGLEPRRLAVLTLLSTIGGFLFGYDTGVVSGAMVLVRRQFSLTPAWHSAIVSVTILSACLASLLAGQLLGRLGRRVTILIASSSFLLGSLLLCLAPGKGCLLLGRLVVGVGVGLASTAVPLYLGECSTAEARGFLVTSNNLAITGGQLVAGLVCGFLSEVEQGWRWMLGLAMFPALVQLLGFLFMPESPRFLVRQEKYQEAGRVLASLRTRHYMVQDELEDIQIACRAERVGERMECGSIFRHPGARKALAVGCLLQAVQQLAGINTIMYFAASILEMAGAGPTLAIWLSAIIAAFNFVFTLLGLKLVTSWSRRSLLLSSLLLVSCSLAFTAFSFSIMKWTGPSLVLISLCFYLIAFAPGLGPLPWTINSELHPSWCRATSISLATATNWVTNFIVSISFLSLTSSLGEPLTFFSYCIISSLGAALLYFHLPETKGVALEQVGDLFLKSRSERKEEISYSRIPVGE